jgi:hypothetical protein
MTCLRLNYLSDMSLEELRAEGTLAIVANSNHYFVLSPAMMPEQLAKLD